MKTRTTLFAALLFAGVSQAALAQDHDRGDRGDRPAAQQDRGGRGGAPAAAPSVAPRPAPQPQSPPPAPSMAPPMAPQGGHARFGAPPPSNVGSPPSSLAPAAAPQPPRPAPDRPNDRSNNDRRWDGDRHWDGDRRGDRPTGDRNTFAPGGTANGDRRWDRHDAPREVAPPGPGERGWDRDHDGHGGDPRALNREPRDNRWDRDRRGPPPNWRHWERGRLPPVYASPRRYHIEPYRAPYGWYVRAWAFGDILPRGWYGPSYWIDDFYDYDLPWPPPGYHWVRVGPDVLLVDDYTGRIVQVVRDLFW